MTIRIGKPGHRKGLSRPARRLTDEQREHRKRTFERFKFGNALKAAGDAPDDMRRLADQAVANGKVTKVRSGYAGHASGIEWEELWAGRSPK
jgi:hypothetical protein